jgi:hypothetical protein
MFASDLVLGLLNGGIYWDYFTSAGYLLVYACIALSTLLGFGLRGKVGAGRVLGVWRCSGSMLFFVVTNFGAWLSDPLYPQVHGRDSSPAMRPASRSSSGRSLGTLVLFGRCCSVASS